jgi:hypothetical protein
LPYFAGTLLEIEKILEAKDKEIDNEVKINIYKIVIAIII